MAGELVSDVRAEEPRSESVAGELARALDRITDGVFTLDRNWVYTFLNPSGARLVGRTPEELVGRNIWTEFPEAVGSEFERRYREAFETQRVVTFEAWYEPFAMWYAVRVFPSSDGLTIYFQDITARRRAEDELAERARQQEALAKLSHRCITESDLERMLADAAGTVASTLDVARVEILGRSSEQSPTAVIARADCDRAVGALETATTIRVPIPGSALAVSDVVVYVDPERPLAADARDFISATAALISSCAQRIQQDRDARHAALHDTLTGLPNRRLLLSHLERALAARSNAGADVAVLMIGVDRFGLINNSFGHDAGDQLLIALAERLREAIGPHAILARPGGDRFVAVVEEPVADLEPTRIAERLHAAFHEPLSLTTGEHFITVSIGIANALSDTSAEALLRDADTALHRAKDRNGTAVFDEEARQAVVRHLALDRELHRALEREELRVFYQPILDLNSERPVAVEALVRWCHPQRGLVAPLEFIGPAEDNGLIIPIGLWVLQQACAQTAAWQREFGVPLQVCVNVSARQVADPSFARHAAQVADGAGLLPGTLELEITESLLMEEAGSPGSVLTELQEYGVRLALDDFGTGYSSLSYLRRFSVDTLKIDRAFVSDLGPGRDAAIVDAMIKMAHAVDLTVVAEGIETPEQKQLLAQLGCDRAQGYLFSRPLPADQLHGLLTA